MKKKYELFKAIMICFLVYVFLSWFIPAGSISGTTVETSGGIAPVGLFGLFYYPLLTIATFIQYAAIIFAIGALYGVLNKTGVYGKLVKNTAKKFERKEKKFLIGIIVLFTVLSSVLGISYGLLVFVPLFVGILVAMGFTNITALAATIGSILVGSIASTYGLGSATQVVNVLGLKMNDNILPKFAFLVIVLVLYVVFIIGKKSSVVEKKGKLLKKENKNLVIPFVDDEKESSKNVKPLVIMLVFLAILLFLSMTNWKFMFGVELFDNFYKQLEDIKVNNLSVVTKILGTTNAFGYWTSYELSALLVIFSFVIGWIYNLGLNGTLEGMKDGALKVIKPAFLISLGSIIFTMMLVGSGTTIFTTIAGKLLALTKGFNFATTSVVGLLTGFFYNDMYYGLSAINGLFTDFGSDYLPIIGFILQSMFNLVMLICPTSLILLSGLSMFDVSLKDWFKYIFKFVVELLVIVLAISIILVLMV